MNTNPAARQASVAECDRMHDPARHERERPRDHQRPDEEPDHGTAVIDGVMPGRMPQAEACHGARARVALKPETKRASVVDVAPRGSMTSISENRPRRATARSSASRKSLRVVTRSP